MACKPATWRQWYIWAIGEPKARRTSSKQGRPTASTATCGLAKAARKTTVGADELSLLRVLRALRLLCHCGRPPALWTATTTGTDLWHPTVQISGVSNTC